MAKLHSFVDAAVKQLFDSKFPNFAPSEHFHTRLFYCDYPGWLIPLYQKLKGTYVPKGYAAMYKSAM